MVKITQQQIRERATDKSFARGESYYRDDAIFDTVQRGNQIEGFCQGSEHTPYHVKAALSEKGIEFTSCTCLYEFGGDCKHIVALLLAYLKKPQAFAQRPSIKQELGNRTKEQLIELIELMVERYPELQDIVDRPAPSSTGGEKPVSTETFRKQLRKALHAYDDDYGGYSGGGNVPSTIESICRAARAFSKRGDWRSAAAIYKAICEECILNGEDFDNHDHDGDVSVALDGVLAELAECADHFPDDPQERQDIFRRMLDVTFWDANDRGGTDLGADVPDQILLYVKTEDIAAIRAHLEKANARAKKTSYYDPFDFFADFLADLDLLDNVDPEIVLQRLRDEERYQLLFDKLIDMQRLDEAVEVVEKYLAQTQHWITDLDVLVGNKREGDAIRIAQSSLKKGYALNTVHWLLARYEAQGDNEAVFKMQLLRMEHNPDTRYYEALKDVAQRLGNWEAVRPSVIQNVKKADRFDILTRIYVIDQEWDLAWETLNLKPTAKGGWAWGYPQLDLEVAKASASARPEKAIPVFIKHARYQIDQRNRSNYQQAAVHLSVVKKLYQQMGNEAIWQKLIGDIRVEYPKLRALQEELKLAGL